MSHENISGIFFVLPCIESYQKVDLRTITLGVPPQEVPFGNYKYILKKYCPGTNQGLSDGIRGRSGVLQGVQCHCECHQHGKCSSLHTVGREKYVNGRTLNTNHTFSS